MQTENNPVKKKLSVKKILLSALIFLCVLLAIPFFGIPVYVSSRGGNNFILQKINGAIDGKVAIRSISMGWFSGIKANKLDFTNTAGSTKLTAEQIAAYPDYISLLGGKVAIDKAIIDKPYLSLTIGIETPKKKQSTVVISQQTKKTPSVPMIPLDRMNLTINQGNVKIIAPDAKQIMQTLELKDINSKIAMRPLGNTSDFNVAMTVAGANDITNIAVAGDMTPKKEWSLTGAYGNLAVDVNDLELATLSPLFKAMNVNVAAAGRLSANVNAEIKKGQFENLEGKVHATNLDVSGDFLKGDRLQSTKFATDVKLSTTEKSINISRLKIEADGLTAEAKGTVPRTFDGLGKFLQSDSTDTMQAQFDCDLAKTLKQVKTIAKFKQDFDINYGRLSGNINTEGQSGKRILAGKIKLWALEGRFPIKQIILSKPVEIDAKLVSQNKQIIFEKLNVDSSFVKANLTGTTDNMNYTADVDLERLQADMGQFIEIKPKLSGSAQLIGKGSFVKKVFASTGSASATNVVIKMTNGKIISEPAAKAGFDFSADFDKQLLTAKTADISADAGKINITNLSMPFGKNTVAATKLHATFSTQIEKLMSLATAFGAADSNTQFAGLAKGDLAFAKTGDVIEASTKQTDITNLKISSPGKEPFTQPNMTIAFTGKFDTVKKIYNIPTLNVTSPQIKLSGNLSNAELGANTKTEGSLKAEYDLAAVSSIVSPFMPQGFTAAGKRNDSLWFSSTYPKKEPQQFKANLSAKTTFGFDKAEYMGFNISKSDFDVKIDKGIMTVAPFTSTVNTGKLNFGGSANFSDKPTLLKTPGQMKIFENIQINQQTSDIILGYMNPIFARATNVSGTLSFDCEKLVFPLEKGYDKTIAIIGTLSITNMRLGSPLLNTIVQLTGGSTEPIITLQPTKFTVADGIISYDNMQMDIGKYPVNFAGRIGLDKSMKMTVTVPYKDQRMPIPLKGSVDKPELDLDLNSLLKNPQIQQEIENQAKKLLEGLLKK
ncbi:MAG: hypothetical protein WC770_01510 [Phycisphaerae bacterium]|jgi:hypothetical protein